MQRLAYLDIRNENIQSLEGLQYAINLEDLHLSRKEISDISVLLGITGLWEFNFSRQKIVLQESSSLKKIKIRDKQGNVPNLKSITGGGFEYDRETNFLHWKQVGENSLLFTSGVNLGAFSGTTTQTVEETSQASEIHAVDKKIKVGDEFDPKAGVTATDKIEE